MSILVKFWALLAGVIMLASAFTVTVYADNDDHEPPVPPTPPARIDDDVKERNQRVVGIEVEPHEAKIISTLDNGDVRNEFKVEFTAKDKFELEMRYKKNNNSAGINLELKLGFIEIVEFIDSNANGKYDVTDNVSSRYNLQDTDYNDIVYATKNTSDNKTEHVLSAQTADGIFRVVLHIAGTFARLSRGTISPTEVKMDFIIDGYHYSKNNTQLALLIKLETDAETKTDNETFDEKENIADNEDEVEISTGDTTAFFSWVINANVDGVLKPVNVTSATDGEGHREVYFAYARGSEITHDPKLGFPFYRTIPGSDFRTKIVPYAIALFVGAVIIGLAVYWRKKKNGTMV
jgi:hypothetical protein